MFRELIVIFLLNCAGFLALEVRDHNSADQFKASLQSHYDKFLQDGVFTSEMEDIFSTLQFPGLFRRKYKSQSKGLLECLTCNTVIKGLLTARRNGASVESLKEVATRTCTLMNIESPEVCQKSIDIQADTLVYIIDNKKDLTSARVCSIIMQNMNCKDRQRKNWKIEIPPRTNQVKLVSNKESNQKPLKVLQISDIHYDPEYTIGSNAACGGQLCCRKGSTPSVPENAAGKWGDYRDCDIPMHIIVNSMDHIIAQHKDLEYIMFTGDIIDHKAWDTTIEKNSDVITEIMQLFKDKFGTTPVLPILGNHEPHPANLFSLDEAGIPELSTQWVFDLTAELWTKLWLPSETRETILKGGYYSFLLRPGFRIVGLNSNVCFNLNWWLLYDDTDQFGQLQWLVGVLLEAERNGEVVHILSHVPTADGDCLQNWGHEFTKIINRFSDTVVAQFNGHTHHDENVIYFNESDSSQAINVAFNGGSLTTYSDVNPNYVVYDVDSGSFEVLDYEVWFYNVTEANLTPDLNPVWYKLYSFKDAYNVASLRPQELANLSERIAGSRELAEQYFRYKHREADSALARGCDDKCHKSNLCFMVTNYYGDKFHCKRLEEIWNAANPKLV